jgi:dehydrogenase/reductase SDR family member 12
LANAIVDTVLDRTVVAGYTNVGYRIRSRAWSASDLQRMDGKVVAVTGASSGIGLAAAEGYARLGATVWVIVRDRERGERACAGIAARSGNDDIHVGVCDLSRLASIRSFAGRFPSRAGRLDVLVNNAGAMTETRELSADGIELTLATNVIGPFALTTRLTELLQRSAPARIINVSSGGLTRSGSGPTICKVRTSVSTGRRCTRAASAPRWSSQNSGPSGSRAAA